jgi:N-acetylmuramoyl-L-alanine amidase
MKKKMYLIALLSLLFTLPTAAQEKVTGLSNVKLFLDPGHDRTENQGLYKYSEAEKTLRVAKAIREYLLTYTDMQPQNIKLCREDDMAEVSLTQRTDAANAWESDFYYSIHSDAGAATANSTLYMYGGWRTNGVVYEKTPYGGKDYGDILTPNLTSVLRVSTRGNMADWTYYNPSAQTHESGKPYLHVNRESDMASLLGETGFHTNPTQQGRNLNAEWKKLEGYATYQSLVKFLSAKFGAGAVDPVQIGIATGFVTDNETGIPINGAKITLVEGSTTKEYTTDSYESLFHTYSNKPNEIHNGFYFIDGLTPGATVDITVEATGFQTENNTITIPSTIGTTTIEGLGIMDAQMLNLLPATVSNVEPVNPTDVSLEKPIIITFSRKMNRATVESAISLLPVVPISFAWTNDYTLRIDISQLAFQTDYTLTIDGSVAKNTVTDDFLDGDDDGTQGGNYVLTFKTSEQDLTKPTIVSYDPADGSQPEVLRPIVRIQFSEALDEESIAPNQITVLDENNETVGGLQQYHAINGVSVMHYLFSADLAIGKTYTVKLEKGALADRYGNEIDLPAEGLQYSFATHPRQVSIIQVIDDFEAGTGGWPTNPTSNSGSTTGVVEAETVVGASPECAEFGTTQSMKLAYLWSEESASHLIRFTKTAATPKFTQGPDNVMQLYVFGDASGSRLRLTTRPGTSGTIWSCLPITIDWAGWKLISWKPGVPADGEIWLAGTGPIDHGTQVNFACFGLLNGSDIQYLPSFILFDNIRIVQIGDYLPTALPNVKTTDGVDVIAAGKAIQVNAPQAIRDIHVYSLSGALIRSIQPQQATYQITTSDWTPGVYIVKVTAEGAQKNVKVIVK